MLNISSLHLAYNDQTVLQLPSLQVAKGDTCLITGASGCGKTTLLYAIAGLHKARDGQVFINGTDVTALSESAFDLFRGRTIGIIFQTLHLVKSLSVSENLQLSSYVSGLRHDSNRTDAVLQQLGIADKKNAKPENLSQGQAQRVAIARAILHRPALILADEPTSSLDDESCDSVITLLKKVAAESDATLLISTHDSRVKPHFRQVLALEQHA